MMSFNRHPRLLLSLILPASVKPQIKEEKKTVVAAVPPPPLSALPGGFLKQLVRDSEKETKHKEPDIKEEKPVSVSASMNYLKG